MDLIENIDKITNKDNDVIGVAIADVVIWECQRCAYVWKGNVRTAGRKPKRCPKCKVKNWSTK